MRIIARRLMVLTVLALFGSALPSTLPAQQKAPEAATTTAAREFLLAMGVDKQFAAALPLIVDQMVGMMARQNPKHEAELRGIMAALVGRMQERRMEIVERIAGLYAQRFSLDELSQMRDFFRSPVGAKLAAAQPELMQQQSAIGRQWGGQIGREIDAEIRSEMRKRGIDL